MKKTFDCATEVAWKGEPVPSSWDSLSAPVRPAHGYLAFALPDESHEPSELLLCDPLTGLVAYPSFEDHMIDHLPGLTANGLHLAIGDVDDLRGYVTAANADDQTLFGHLAGNECMRCVGEVTRQWTLDIFENWPFADLGLLELSDWPRSPRHSPARRPFAKGANHAR